MNRTQTPTPHRAAAAASRAAPLSLSIWLALSATAQAQNLPPPPVSPAPMVRMEYDAQGNFRKLVRAPGAGNLATSTDYDRLHRPTTSTDARGKPTRFSYDGRENLLQVTDPRNLVTQYPRTGLGDATGLVSPDTGTASHTLDAAGQLLTRTDSRGVTATYSYDTLNRLTSVVYAQGGPSQAFSWLYDQVGPGFSNGIGRLTSTQFPGGGTSHRYDAQGRLVGTTQTVNAGTTVTLAVGYGYDAAGNITSITYPSGRVLFIPHVAGLPAALNLAPSTGAAALPLLSGLEFEPGPGRPGTLRAWKWELNGGSLPHQRVFDLYGRMVRYPLGGAVRDITYDAADRIASYTHLSAATGQATTATQALNQFFTYDEAGRLTGVATPGGSWTYAYDDNGNRLLATQSAGTASSSRNYTVAGNSNRLLGLDNPVRSFAHDAAGNTQSSTEGTVGWTASHDLSGRLTRLVTTAAAGANDTNYLHDGNGLRVLKRPTQAQVTPPGEDPGLPGPPRPVTCITRGALTICTQSASALPAGGLVFMHDLEGRLLGEYDGSTGATLREYIWLQGMPVAFVDGAPANPSIYYVQTDHIDTPRVVLDRAGRQRWSWVAEPFGNSAPVENPIGVGAVKLNLRMPGQYFDEESGLSYNWNRTYDAGVGSYTQSDPIGLAGGINTYAYVEGNPLSYTDPDGLQRIRPGPVLPGLVPRPVDPSDPFSPNYTPMPQPDVGALCRIAPLACATVMVSKVVASACEPSPADCQKEWLEAENICFEWIQELKSSRTTARRRKQLLDLTGGSMGACKMGQVSQACGGNKVKW